MKHSWICWAQWAFLASSAANQWACVCSVSGRHCSDFSGIRLNFVWLRNQETVFSKAQGLYLKASPSVVSSADGVPKKSKIIVYSAPCTLAKAHTKKQNKDLMVWLGEIIHSYTRWWSALLWSSDLCLAICLFKTLGVSSCTICLRNMIGVTLVCSFSCGSQRTSRRQYL